MGMQTRGSSLDGRCESESGWVVRFSHKMLLLLNICFGVSRMTAKCLVKFLGFHMVLELKQSKVV